MMEPDNAATVLRSALALPAGWSRRTGRARRGQWSLGRRLLPARRGLPAECSLRRRQAGISIQMKANTALGAG